MDSSTLEALVEIVVRADDDVAALPFFPYVRRRVRRLMALLSFSQCSLAMFHIAPTDQSGDHRYLGSLVIRLEASLRALAEMP